MTQQQLLVWMAAVAAGAAAVWFAINSDWLQSGGLLLGAAGLGFGGMVGSIRAVRHDKPARELIAGDREWQGRLKLLGQAIEKTVIVEPGEAERAQPAAGARKRSQKVEATVFAPDACKASETFRVQVFFHAPADRDVAQTTAKSFDPTTGARARRPLSMRVARGQVLHVMLQADAPDILMTGSAPRIEWDGEPVSLDFLVQVNRKRGAMTAGFVAIVLVDGKPAGELAFTVAIARKSAARSALPAPADATVRRFEKMFLSYARKDLDTVRLIARALDLQEKDYFWDINGLQSGDEWRKELYRRIDEVDAFVLIWSQAAKDSKNVRDEVERALAVEQERKKLRLVFFPIEGPPPPGPWDIIAHRHIGDPVYYGAARSAQASGRAAAA
jgi:hypothetical protein